MEETARQAHQWGNRQDRLYYGPRCTVGVTFPGFIPILRELLLYNNIYINLIFHWNYLFFIFELNICT